MDTPGYYWQSQCVRLRPVQPDDWRLACEEEEDSEGIRVLEAGIQLPRSPEQLCEAYRQAAEQMGRPEDTGTLHFIVETLDGQPVGAIWMHGRHPRAGNFSFGVRIHRTQRRHGYAAEAIRILLRYGFEELRYHKANSATIACNEASVRLHLALGFQIEGRLRENAYTSGRYYDEVLFGMTRADYDAVVAVHAPERKVPTAPVSE